MSTLRVTYRKSRIGYAEDQKATLKALGLRKLNHSVDHQNTSSIRGMVHKVRHLVNVNGVPADTPEGMAVLGDGAASEKSR